MTTAIAAKRISLTIGSQNWSDWVTNITTGYTELDDGILETSATLTLSLPANFNQLPSDPRYELNPTRWARGQVVRLRVANDAGTLVDAPCGWLYILAEPTDAEINRDFQLSLGCALSLNNFREPDDDLSGVQIGVPTARHIIIGKLLDAAGVSHSLTSMGSTLDYPLPKRGGSYVEQAGILARAVNQFLYCGIDGVCRNAPIDFAQSVYATYAIGVDEALWEPSQAAEIPVEELTIAGVTYDLVDPNIGNVFVTTEFVSEGEINPNAFDPSRQVIGERKTVTTFGYNPTTQEQRVTTLVERPIVTIEPPSETTFSFGQPPAEFLVEVSFVEETEKFDAEGKLETRTVTSKEPRRIINPADGTRELKDSKIETTTYTYTSDKTIAQIDTVVQEAAARVNPEAADKLELVFSEDARKTWAETPVDSGIWFNTERYRVAQRRAALPPTGSSIGYNPYLPVSDPNKEDIQQRGTDLQPPSVEYRNPDRNQKERQIKAIVNTPPLAGASFRSRKRTINVDGCTSEQQLYDYGVLFNRLLTGRRFGRRIGFRVSDAWLSATVRPLLRVDAIFNGATYKLLLDGLTWSYAQNEAFLVGNGILIEANGVQLAQPVVIARINAQCGECTAAIAATATGNLLIAQCDECTAAIAGRVLDDPGAIDFRFNKPENSLTLGVL